MDHDEFVTNLRGFPEIENDDELYHFAEVVTGNWYKDGSCRRFIDYKLNESMKEHPYHDLTLHEFARLRLMQADKQDEAKTSYDDEGWYFVKRVEDAVKVQELWRNKYGHDQIRTRIKLL